MIHRIKLFMAALLVTGLGALPALSHEVKKHDDDMDRHHNEKHSSNKQVEMIRESEQVLREAVTAPDNHIPRELLERAECIGVFPEVKKGAFMVGGEFGRGLFTCRQDDGSMSAPAFFKIGGPSFGWQFGGQSADIVLLIMNESGVRHLLEDKFTIGGNASAVAGPVGRTARAATDIQLHAQILSWSRSRGAFLGVSLDGVVIKPSQDSIQAYYGEPLTASDILIDNQVEPPESALSFIETANQYVRSSS